MFNKVSVRLNTYFTPNGSKKLQDGVKFKT